jgi:predicted metal-dependent enzyme (double-stranded beta helix superfamily)
MTASDRFDSVRETRLAAIVDPLTRAMETDRATTLAAVLSSLGKSNAFADESLFAPPSASRYSRGRLWADPAGRFTIVSMTWLPGQGTAVHDHAGRWGAELVVRGTMLETSYRLGERDGAGRARLVVEHEKPIDATQVGVILPNVDIHEVTNVGTGVAHTVHVYSTLVDACTTFTPDGDGWWTPAAVALAYDA